MFLPQFLCPQLYLRTDDNENNDNYFGQTVCQISRLLLLEPFNLNMSNFFTITKLRLHIVFSVTNNEIKFN